MNVITLQKRVEFLVDNDILIFVAAGCIHVACTTNTLHSVLELETITKSEAILFPIIGSISLFSMYLLLNYYPWILTGFMTGYILFMGTGACWYTLTLIDYKRLPKMIRFRIDYQNNNYFDYSINVFDIFYLVVSLCIVIMYHLTKHYILSNCIAISISIIGIKLVQLDSFKTAMVLLTLLFFYDIFWVFKTNVMVTVATTLDFPLKLQIPKSFFSSIESNGFSILGLGDIVVPGLFLHLLYQLDKCHKTSYYRIGLCFYQIGLLAAIVCCLYFETGQPALLYICPSVIGSAIGTSLYRHEWDLLWNFIIPNENQVDSNSKVVKTTNQYRYSLRNRNRNK